MRKDEGRLVMYDYLIVGAGLFGSVFAREAASCGKRCLVIEKRNHTGGNIYCENLEGIHVHKYGPHIFHTDLPEVWEYANQFCTFNHFVYSPLANYKGEIYNLPFNMNTFYKMWGVTAPQEAKKIIENQVREAGITEPKNLEEQAVSLVGKDIYEKLVKGYTEKQWGRDCRELPAFIIRRLPVRFIYDNNYFSHPYQGIPIGSYNVLIENLLKGNEVRLNTDYLKERDKWDMAAKKVLYTGPIDAYFDYAEGHLEYRSLRFETEVLHMENYQGCAGMNYTDRETPWTRITEHKHFEFGNQPKTVISREYSVEWRPGDEPYYPVNDKKNQKILKRYQELAKKQEKVIFGGRLGEYRYYDMDQVIASALRLAKQELSMA